MTSQQSTDRTSIDTDQDIPRVVLSGSTTVTADSSNVAGLGVYTFNTTIPLPTVSSDANVLVKAWATLSGTPTLYKIPFTTMNTTTGAIDITSVLNTAANTIDPTQDVAVSIYRNTATGSASDVFTVYYQVLSTKITNDTLL